MRDATIEQRLIRWGQWLKVGDGSGFPTMSVLHPNWQPPSKGQTPTMKAGAGGSDVRQTHRLVGTLSQRMQATLVVHYVKGGALAEQAGELQCAERTVHARVDLAHRLLRRMLSEPAEFLQHAVNGVDSGTLG